MFYDLYLRMCNEKQVSPTKAAIEIGISKATPTTWKKKGFTPQGDTLNKIADYFGVSTDYLLGSEQKENTPALTYKDERDISRQLEATLAELEQAQGGLMFDGEPLDDETKELLAASLRNQLEMTKRLAKQKFTPKKYRKEGE